MAAALAFTATATACGSDAGGSSGGSESGDCADEGTATVRFGSVGGLTDAGLYIADSRGYFEEAGIELEMSRMGGGSEISAAISTGNLEVAGFAVTAGLFNAVAGDLELKIVGDKQSILPEASATHLVALESLVGSSTTETIQHLKGQDVALSSPESSTVPLLDWTLQEHGLTIDDVNIVQMSYPELTSALITGQIAGAIELEPFLTRVLQEGDVADVDDLTAVVPEDGGSIVPLVYSQDFIDAECSKAQAFMTAYVKGVRDYNDAMLHDVDKQEIAEIIAEASEQPVELVLDAHVAGLHPNQEVSLEFFEQIQDYFVEKGMVAEPVDMTDVVDSSFAEAAVEELGAYEPGS